MSSDDPLSDPLSQEATSPSHTRPSAATNVQNWRELDLFAAPFQSALWSEDPPRDQPIDDLSPLQTGEAQQQAETAVTDAGTEQGAEAPASRTSTLSAHAPTFVPTFTSLSLSAASSSDQPISISPPSLSTLSQPPVSVEEDPESFVAPSMADRPLYSAGTTESPTHDSEIPKEEEDVGLEREFRPSLTLSTELPPPPSRTPSTTSTYSPSILRNLIAQSCQSGDLTRLKLLVRSESSDKLFALANSINSTTGLAPIHHAAKKGHSEIVKWLVESCGAMIGMEDSDGETALHKACLSGKLETAEYLSEDGRGFDINATDNDGWTPLHNACSIGSLPLISLLLSRGASLSPLSSHGYTPLMNAASKGHLPAVHLLLKRGADPLIRNEWGETAFDLAAGVFEVRCCEVLGSYEKVAWSAKKEKAKRSQRDGQARIEEYSLLGLHSTVPVVLYENQRLVTPSLMTRLPTLSKLVDSGDQRWTSKALSRNDKRAAFTVPRHVFEGLTEGEAEEGEGEERACFRSEVGLPVIGEENRIVFPAKREVRSGGRVRVPETAVNDRPQTLKKRQSSSASTSLSSILGSTLSPSPSPLPSTRAQSTPAWTWISSWTIDRSSPLSSPVDGWSYSQSFTTPDEAWQPSLPLEGTGNAKKWVRRRRWVRVMRRRVDLKSWGYSDSPTLAALDYRSKAQFLFDQARQGEEEEEEVNASDSLISSRQSRARLERAAEVLRSGIEADEDDERKREARADLEKILERLALLSVQTESAEEQSTADAGSDDEFVYNGRDAGQEDEDDARSIWTTTRPSSLRAPSIFRDSEAFISDDLSTTPTATSHFPQQRYDLPPQLAQNPDFRIPTDEHASFYPSTPRSDLGQLSIHQTAWEPDEATNECRRCGDGFTLWRRRHHCRRCGLVCCANCTTHKDPIDPHLVVREPGIPSTLEDLQPWSLASPLLYRTCDSCHAALALPGRPSTNSATSVLSPQSFFPPSPSIGSNTPSESNVSESSDLTDCPCCGAALRSFGDRSNQEAHVRKCLEEGEGSIASGRYLVFNLLPGPLVGEDCGICFETFEVNDRLARLVCLCTFHETCIRAWITRGNTCPVHVPREV